MRSRTGTESLCPRWAAGWRVLSNDPKGGVDRPWGWVDNEARDRSSPELEGRALRRDFQLSSSNTESPAPKLDWLTAQCFWTFLFNVNNLISAF